MCAIRAQKWYLIVILFAWMGSSAQAAPGLVYQYGPHKKVEVRALVGVEEPMTAPNDNCDQRIAEVTVADVAYNGTSDMISGLRATKPAPNEWTGLFSINSKAVYDAIPDVTRTDLQKLIHRGARLIITYQVCGSGGYASIRDVYMASSLNNP